MTLTVRTASRDDAASITRVRVDTWRAAYAGLMASEILDGMDADREAERRRERWDEMHGDPRGCDLLAEVDGVVAGWAALGSSIDDDRPRDGQIYAIYARPEFWSRGVGHALLVTAEQRLRTSGFRKAHLWVLDRNERAASFYERHGWREDGATMTDERRIDGTGFTLLERRRVRDLRERLSPR
ncbi:GNAT family N-acetyltransferase [Microbacterium sulfonylureivorans]|uniref:GNAT family N-acetyltransferase n=1 Tax=Microbacterium sulfonylureivorans TaxID=2486854 RepID=UPI000FDB99CC|nr:GNAT family N-acetyltransferase [Microbacterium sulfonylureivorans]